MFEAGNYRRRRTRRQRHAKMLLSGQFHQQTPSAFTIYPELVQRAHLQQAHAFALSLEHQQKQHLLQQSVITDDSETSDNDQATADDEHVNADTAKCPSSSTSATDDAANYLSHLDKLLKNQFLHQINFHAAINECNRGLNHHQHDHPHTDLMTRDNDGKMNLKSTNFTIENLIRK